MIQYSSTAQSTRSSSVGRALWLTVTLTYPVRAAAARVWWCPSTSGRSTVHRPGRAFPRQRQRNPPSSHLMRGAETAKVPASSVGKLGLGVPLNALAPWVTLRAGGTARTGTQAGTEEPDLRLGREREPRPRPSRPRPALRNIILLNHTTGSLRCNYRCDTVIPRR